MPTAQPRPWSTQYKEAYNKSRKKTKRVTLRATPITYTITPSDQKHGYLKIPAYGPGPGQFKGTPVDLSRSRHPPVESESISVNTRPPLRPYSTPALHRVPTPYLTGPPGDIEDRPDTVRPSYLFGDTETLDKGEPLTFVPELNSWVTKASTDYEKDTAYKVGETMQRTYTPLNRSRSVSPRRTRPFYGRSHTQAEGFNNGTADFGYPQTWNPYGGMPTTPIDDRYLPSHLNGADPYANYTMYPQTAREPRPMARHMRRNSLSSGYVHDLSCFQSTQPMVTGHFVIHPDWVSERMTPRRKPAKKSQLRY